MRLSPCLIFPGCKYTFGRDCSLHNLLLAIMQVLAAGLPDPFRNKLDEEFLHRAASLRHSSSCLLERTRRNG